MNFLQDTSLNIRCLHCYYRTSLPSVCSKDHWFDDAGTTGFEVWSSAITALCMCLNNPQNGLFSLITTISGGLLSKLSIKYMSSINFLLLNPSHIKINRPFEASFL